MHGNQRGVEGDDEIGAVRFDGVPDEADGVMQLHGDADKGAHQVHHELFPEIRINHVHQSLQRGDDIPKRGTAPQLGLARILLPFVAGHRRHFVRSRVEYQRSDMDAIFVEKAIAERLLQQLLATYYVVHAARKLQVDEQQGELKEDFEITFLGCTEKTGYKRIQGSRKILFNFS